MENNTNIEKGKKNYRKRVRKSAVVRIWIACGVALLLYIVWQPVVKVTNVDKRVKYDDSGDYNFDYDSDVWQVLFKYNELNEKYWNDKKNLWELYVYDLNDYKNISAIDDYIYNWKLYKKYSKEFYDGVNNLKLKYTDIEDSQKKMLNVTSNFLWQIDKLSDANIEFLSYIKTIQDEFYVVNWQITFVTDNEAYQKYLQLAQTFANEADIYNKNYAEFMDYVDESLKETPEYKKRSAQQPKSLFQEIF